MNYEGDSIQCDQSRTIDIGFMCSPLYSTYILLMSWHLGKEVTSTTDGTYTPYKLQMVCTRNFVVLIQSNLAPRHSHAVIHYG